jgi:biopolymer transport protein ExbD
VFEGARKRREAEDATPNMIPVMNLFVTMIPFLLSIAVFAHLRVINASVPTISDNNTIEAEKRKVIATLRIEADGLRLSAGNEFISAEEEKEMRFFFPARRNGEQDLAKLRDVLATIKRRYPLSDTLILVPDREILYDTLVQAMDATRRVPGAKETCVDPQCYLLPNVVVSSLVQ